MTREDGMTIVEVLVAGLILVAGALGVLGIVDAGTRNTFRAEQSQVVSNLLQQEIEKLRQIPYEELAMTSLPAHVSDPEDPNSRISSLDFFYTGRNGTGLKPLVHNGGTSDGEPIDDGTVDPGPTDFQVGDLKGTVYRYVVWDTCPSGLCADGRHLKRAVVVVRLDQTASGGTRRYQEIQGQFVDPAAEPAVLPEQEPGGTDDDWWTLWLTDTPCNAAKRLIPTGDHLTHNTRGDCGNGLQAGGVPGAPDLLSLEAADEAEDTKYDYATDVEVPAGGEESLQLLPGEDCETTAALDLASGVVTEPDPHPEAFKKVHRWLSPPVPPHAGSQDLLLTGDGTLSLWTRTIGGAVHPARICAWIFSRTQEGTSVIDTFAYNLGPPLSLHFSYFAQSWPSVKWDEITLPLSFGHAQEGGALPLLPGSRLGLAVSVGSDTMNPIQLGYDTPTFDSRILLATAGAPPPTP